MAFSKIELEKIDNLVGGLCRKRSPVLHKNELRMEYSVTGHDVMIFECRPHWNDPTEWLKVPIAKLKFTRKSSVWKLYWHRSTGKWISYEPLQLTKDLVALVNEIDDDPSCIFFG